MTQNSMGAVQRGVLGKQGVRLVHSVEEPGLVDVLGLVLQLLV